MVKIQFRRLAHAPLYNEDKIDTEFVRGGMKDAPTIGESFVFYRDRLDAGWWRTTPVTEIVRVGREVEFKTLNSTYVIKKGWGE